MKILASLALAIIIFSTVSLFVPKLNGFGPQPIKQQLTSQQVYQDIHTLLDEQILSNPTLSQDPEAAQIIKQVITVEYIETKLNKALDDSTAWVTQTSQTEPTISFNDLKQQLLDNHSKGQEAIDLIQQAASSPEVSAEQTPQISADPEAQEALDQLLASQQTLQSFSQGDFTLHLKSYLEAGRWTYSAYSIALIVLPLLIVALLAIILFTSGHKLQTAAFVFTATGLSLLVMTAISQLVLINWLLQATYTQLGQHLPLVNHLVQAITTPLLTNFLVTHLLVAVPITLVGLACYLANRRQAQPAPLQPEKDLPVEAAPATPASTSKVTA